MINTVGNILQFYNTNKQINLYGFGGAVPPYSQRASHCFALNGDIFNPRVNGLEEVVQAYQNALKNVALYGPTHFSDILRQVNSIAESEQVSQYNQKFEILLLITDGIINDMAKTIDEIVRGSALPLAIIIVGVGDADFSNMDVLDGDDEALYSTALRKYMEADIVQFVPFNEFKHNPHLLAKETLAEVPTQLLNFYRKHNIAPFPKSEAQRQAMMQQLSMRQNYQPTVVPPYFAKQKEYFLQQASEMGFDMFQVQDFLEQKGLVELQMGNIVDNLHNPNFRNVLKETFRPAQPVLYQQPGAPMGQPGMSGPPMGGQAPMFPQNAPMNQMMQQVVNHTQQQLQGHGYVYQPMQ